MLQEKSSFHLLQPVYGGVVMFPRCHVPPSGRSENMRFEVVSPASDIKITLSLKATANKVVSKVWGTFHRSTVKRWTEVTGDIDTLGDVSQLAIPVRFPIFTKGTVFLSFFSCHIICIPDQPEDSSSCKQLTVHMD